MSDKLSERLEWLGYFEEAAQAEDLEKRAAFVNWAKDNGKIHRKFHNVEEENQRLKELLKWHLLNDPDFFGNDIDAENYIETQLIKPKNHEQESQARGDKLAYELKWDGKSQKEELEQELQRLKEAFVAQCDLLDELDENLMIDSVRTLWNELNQGRIRTKPQE